MVYVENAESNEAVAATLKKRIFRRTNKNKVERAMKKCLDIFGEFSLNAVEGNLVASYMGEVASDFLKKSQLFGKPEEFAVLNAEIADMAKRKAELYLRGKEKEKKKQERKTEIDPESGEELDIVSAKPLPKNCLMYR